MNESKISWSIKTLGEVSTDFAKKKDGQFYVFKQESALLSAAVR